MDSVLQFVSVAAISSVVVASAGAWVVSVADFARRDGLDSSERVGWIVAFIVFAPVAGLIYLRCGPGEGCLASLLGRHAL